MTASIETARDLRKKLKRASKSRDDWRDKHRTKQYEIKKLKVHLTSVRSIRDGWKSRCVEAELRALELEELVDRLAGSSDSTDLELSVASGSCEDSAEKKRNPLPE